MFIADNAVIVNNIPNQDIPQKTELEIIVIIKDIFRLVFGNINRESNYGFLKFICFQ